MYEQSYHKRSNTDPGFKPRILVLISDEEEDLDASSRYCVIEGDKDGTLRRFHPSAAA